MQTKLISENILLTLRLSPKQDVKEEDEAETLDEGKEDRVPRIPDENVNYDKVSSKFG